MKIALPTLILALTLVRRLMGFAAVGSALMFLAQTAMAQAPPLMPPQSTPVPSVLPPGIYSPKVKHDTPEEREGMIRIWEQNMARNPPEKVPPLAAQRISPRVAPAVSK
jgi:hypothetical protein